jgi:hypothetical protein
MGQSKQLTDLMFSEIFVEAPGPTVLGLKGPLSPDRIESTPEFRDEAPYLRERRRFAVATQALGQHLKFQEMPRSRSQFIGGGRPKPVGEWTWPRGLVLPNRCPESRGEQNPRRQINTETFEAWITSRFLLCEL